MADVRQVDAVLFDLDGTLADTAPDLASALNQMLAARGMAPIDQQVVRPFVSTGARGLLKIGFGKAPPDHEYDALLSEFLHCYAGSLCRETTLFDGIAAALDEIERNVILWGVVTNKSQRFALPVLDQLGLRNRCACIVCGDSSPRAKPHVHPMRLACAVMNRNPEAVWYIGDDQRDIQSGRAAGMRTGIASWGYLGNTGSIHDWGADRILADAFQLRSILS